MAFARLSSELKQAVNQEDNHFNDPKKACSQAVQRLLLALAEVFCTIPSQEDLQLGRVTIEGIDIFIQALKINQQPVVRLLSPIAKISPAALFEIQSLAMSANYHGRETQGGVLGLNPKNQTLSFAYQPLSDNPWNMEVDTLAEHLFFVFQQASHWQSLCDQIQSGQVSSADLQLHHLHQEDQQKGMH